MVSLDFIYAKVQLTISVQYDKSPRETMLFTTEMSLEIFPIFDVVGWAGWHIWRASDQQDLNLKLEELINYNNRSRTQSIFTVRSNVLIVRPKPTM